MIPDVAAPSQIYLEESGRETATVPDLGYDFTPPAPYGISEALHAGTVMTDRQLRQTELPTGMVPVDAKLPVMEVIGQLGGIYILATTDTGELVLIDQHAVHERILYEQVIARTEGDHRSQELLVPFILHRTLQETAILRDLIPALAQEGFVLEEFGRDTFLVRAIPVVLGKLEDTTMIDEMVSDLVSEEAGPFSKHPGKNYPYHCMPGCNQGRYRLYTGTMPATDTPDTVCKKSVHLPPRKTNDAQVQPD